MPLQGRGGTHQTTNCSKEHGRSQNSVNPHDSKGRGPCMATQSPAWRTHIHVSLCGPFEQEKSNERGVDSLENR